MRTTDISLTSLLQQCGTLRSRGITLKAAEVGRMTWRLILDCGGAPPDTEEVKFMGMAVRPADVPEGQIWPLENVR